MPAAAAHEIDGFGVREQRDAALRERGIAEHELLHRVGDDASRTGFGRDARDRLQHGAAMAVGDAGIHHHDAVVSDDEPGVADVACILRRRLSRAADEGVHAVGDLHRLDRRCDCRELESKEQESD